MAGWRTSSWYGSSWYNSTWYGGTGGGGAAATGGGGAARDVTFHTPLGWREITEKELRRSAERADKREREKRFARLREGLRRDEAPKAPETPARREPFIIVDAILIGHGGPVDALARMLAKFNEDREREEREARELAKVARRVTLGRTTLVRRAIVMVLGGKRAMIEKGSFARRAVVTGFGVRRTRVWKFDPDQPRDEAGRFGEGGGAAGAVGGSKPVDHKTAAKAFAKVNAQTFKTGDAKAIKEAQTKFLAAQGFDDKEITAFAQHEKQWYSSVYTEGGQMMRQVAAREMGRDFKAADFHDSKPILDRTPTDRERAMVNAVRSFTTEGLREKYGDSVTVYRGVTDSQADALMGGEGSTVDMGLNSLSSWSLEKDTAENYALFGKTKSGALVSVKVPVENIWLADFKEGRNEVVIGAKSQRVRVPRSAVSPRMRKAAGVGEFSYPTGGGALVVLDDDPESANWLTVVDSLSITR